MIKSSWIIIPVVWGLPDPQVQYGSAQYPKRVFVGEYRIHSKGGDGYGWDRFIQVPSCIKQMLDNTPTGYNLNL
jgi:hypothetical protein